MIHQQRLMLRMAMAIHEQLQPKTTNEPRIQLPTELWHQVELLNRKCHKAIEQNWTLSANRLNRDMRAAIERLRYEVSELENRFRPINHVNSIASVRDIRSDLMSLHDEFEHVALNLRERTLSVTTEAIVLEGTYLGPFEIRLALKKESEGLPFSYRVIAVDPNPAAANESVTHPHVQDESVCEGDGKQPIRQALEQGRLLDFFLIVANLLRTYNSGSPFVALSDWQGVECSDCGTVVDNDDRWTCQECETAICSECNILCPGCSDVFCHDCVSRCEGCDEHFCNGCLDSCSDCGATLCQDCLENDERCSCNEQEVEAKEMQEGRAGPQSENETAVQSDRLGQVALPA